MQISKDFSI